MIPAANGSVSSGSSGPARAAVTPGDARAAERSTERSSACAQGERANATCSGAATWTSSTNMPRPARSGRSSRRSTDCPIQRRWHSGHSHNEQPDTLGSAYEIERSNVTTTKMPSRLEIAQSATLRPIGEIAEELGLGPRRSRPVRQVQGQGRSVRPRAAA